MQQLHGNTQDMVQYPLCLQSGWILPVEEPGLHELDIPVTELLPDKLINLLKGDAQFKVVKVFGHFSGKSVSPAEDPLVSGREFAPVDPAEVRILIEIHQHKSRGIPYLVGKIPAGFHLLRGKSQVVPGRITCSQSEPQRISTILPDHFKRIYAVAEGFAHLPALRVSDYTMDEYMTERLFSHMLKA